MTESHMGVFQRIAVEFSKDSLRHKWRWLQDKILHDHVFFLFAAWLIFLFAIAMAPPLYRFGDASEYILNTQSLYHDRDLVITEVPDIVRSNSMKPDTIDVPAGVGYLPDKNGNPRVAYHPFLYPLSSLPFYALFKYRGFIIFNVLLVFVSSILLYIFLHEKIKRNYLAFTVTISLFVFSSVLSYLYWIHTETYMLFLMVLFLFALYKQKPFWASFALGLLVADKLNLLLLAPLYLYTFRKLSFKKLILSALIFIFLASIPYAYNFYYYDKISPITSATRLQNISLGDILYVFFAPEAGLVWFYPLVLLGVFNTKFNKQNILLLVTGVAAMSSFTIIGNLYSHQIGLRYANYVYPLFIFLIETVDFNRLRQKFIYLFSIFSTSSIFLFPLQNAQSMDLDKKYYLPYKILNKLGMDQSVYSFRYVDGTRFEVDKIVAKGLNQANGWTNDAESPRVLVYDANDNKYTFTFMTGDHLGGQYRVQFDSFVKEEFYLNPSTVYSYVLCTKGVSMVSHTRIDYNNYFFMNIDSDKTYMPMIAGNPRPGIQMLQITSKDKDLFTLPGYKPEEHNPESIGIGKNCSI